MQHHHLILSSEQSDPLSLEVTLKRSRTGAAYDSAGMTIVGGSDDATDKGSVSVVLVIGATVEGPRTCKSG